MKSLKTVLALALAAALVLSLNLTAFADSLPIGIPDDGTNLSRGIKLLETAGLITVDPEAGYTPEIADITGYLYDVEVTPVQANTLPSTLADFGASTINGTYAIPFGLIPSRDGLIIEKQSEDGDNPYVNIIAARTEDAENEVYQTIVKAYQTQAVAEFLLVNYEEAFFPAFDYKDDITLTKEEAQEIVEYSSPKKGKTVVKVGVCGANNDQWQAVQKVLDEQDAGIYRDRSERLPAQGLSEERRRGKRLRCCRHRRYPDRSPDAVFREVRFSGCAEGRRRQARITVAVIEVRNLKKTYHLKSGDVTALDGVSLSIEDGSVYGVIGYSGAGKSSLVRCLNLLEIPDEGTITMGEYRDIEIRSGEPWYQGRRMDTRRQNEMRRGIGMIFQHFNLLERSTVFDNIAYPLKYTGRSREEIRDRVFELLELVDLLDKVDVFPSQLSGGQKQRVAIARALAANPKILLSDEATSALDPDATESILNLLKDLNRKLGITIVIITHEMAVIKTIADRVAVMENGRIAEEGSVYDVFSDPKAEITKKFINSSSPLGKIERMIAEDSGFTRLRPGEKLVKLIFQKESVGEPVLTVAAQRFGVTLNIILANVEYLHGNPFGGTIGVLSGRPEDLDAAIRFLKDSHVRVEVLKDASLD